MLEIFHFIFSNLTARLRRRRSSVELAMNIYPGDLLVQEHHKRLLKRNTVADFNTLRNGSSQSISDGNWIFYIEPISVGILKLSTEKTKNQTLYSFSVHLQNRLLKINAIRKYLCACLYKEKLLNYL